MAKHYVVMDMPLEGSNWGSSLSLEQWDKGYSQIIEHSRFNRKGAERAQKELTSHFAQEGIKDVEFVIAIVDE